MSFRKSVDAARIDREAALQARAAVLGLAPRVQAVEAALGNGVLVMDIVDGESLFELHGDDARDIPDALWARVVDVTRRLAEGAGILFVDCTPYNFMLDSAGDLYAIDYGDAQLVEEGARSEYLEGIWAGARAWNADFA